jgi:hypothetical protein
MAGRRILFLLLTAFFVADSGLLAPGNLLRQEICNNRLLHNSIQELQNFLVHGVRLINWHILRALKLSD